MPASTSGRSASSCTNASWARRRYAAPHGTGTRVVHERPSRAPSARAPSCGWLSHSRVTPTRSPRARAHGRAPQFEAPELEETQRRITSDALSFPPDAAVSDEAKELLGAILVKDPEARLSLDGILAHPWIAAHSA
eukprot:7377557-Prymnesium_polylepis.3